MCVHKMYKKYTDNFGRTDFCCVAQDPVLVFKNELKKYTMMGRIRFSIQQYKLGVLPLFGKDGLFDMVFPRDLSITSGKVYYVENTIGDAADIIRVWPPEQKVSQNNIFDKLLRIFFPTHR